MGREAERGEHALLAQLRHRAPLRRLRQRDAACRDGSGAIAAIAAVAALGAVALRTTARWKLERLLGRLGHARECELGLAEWRRGRLGLGRQ